MDPTQENMVALTQKFFSGHWNSEALGASPPHWSERYTFAGSLPNHEFQGVYAFVNESGRVTYIGVGSSKGAGRYAGHGLGKRFQAYSRVVDGAHTPTDDRLIEAGGIMTIGFSQHHAYLANALELYLLGRLETYYNTNRPG